MFERLLGQPGRRDELAKELLELVTIEIERSARPRPGALSLLADLEGRVLLGVASNSPHDLLHSALRVTGLRASFDAIVSGDEVRAFKPAPDIYLAICDRLGVPPTHAVALEDSPPGVAAARAAGMFVIGVPSLEGVELEADLVVPSLADPALRTAVGLAR
jgi:HAD superfamily hydrolase (TIGR01509 family)